MEYLRIGIVLRPQGVRGELKVQPLTDDPDRFRQLEEVYLEGKKGGSDKSGPQRGGYERRALLSVSVRDGAVYLQLEGVPDRNAAELLRNRYLCVDREHAVKLPEGRYFVCDLIGCTVVDSEGKHLGRLCDVFETGANDVYSVRQDDGKTFLVPALRKLLAQVDVANKRIVFDAKVLEEVIVRDED